MPKGDNPNSRKNLKQGNPETQFAVENAVENAEKSHKAQAWKKTVREAIHEKISPEEVADLILDMAKRRNLKALEMVLDVTGEKAAAKIQAEVIAEKRNPFSGMSVDEIKELIEDA